ncbi:MAG: hypothetical protein INF91_10505 [Alphaproteobacteria bacterium]|nr:hypothetical protein [Alphaproteobacteria bacterium]
MAKIILPDDRAPASPLLYPWERRGAVAVDVLLAWAFNEQRIGSDGLKGLHAIEQETVTGESNGFSGDGCYTIEQRHRVGAVIDTFGPGAAPEHHPAADAVAEAVAKLPSGTRGLVTKWARAGVAPGGWREPARSIIARDWRDGYGEAYWVHVGANGKSRETPVMVNRSQASIDLARAEYAAWHGALGELFLRLSTRALGFVVLPPAAPAAPWVVEPRDEPDPLLAATLARSDDALEREIGVVTARDVLLGSLLAGKKLRGRALLVAWTATWCSPSADIVRELAKLSALVSERILVVHADVDRAPACALAASPEALPLLALHHRGRLIGLRKGTGGHRTLRDWAYAALDR